MARGLWSARGLLALGALVLLARFWAQQQRGFARWLGQGLHSRRRRRVAPGLLGRSGLPEVGPPKGWQPPEPKPLTVTRSDLWPALVGGGLALVIRFLPVFVVGWRPGIRGDGDEGKYALQLGPIAFRDSSLATEGKLKRPEKPLILYEYEGSPFCRKVREALSMLDVSCEMRPCPGARSGFSAQLAERTGRMTVPYLIDPNSGQEMFESDDIVDYLFDAYGPGKGEVPFSLREPFSGLTGGYATLFRGLAGSKPEPAALPENTGRKPLELWGYDASPFVKIVRERLCSLMLPHVMVPCARGSANRDVMMSQTGVQFQVPFLRDANTGVELFEAAEICEYLDSVYTKPP